MSDLSFDADELLKNARSVDDPTEGDKARVHAALALRLAATTATAAALSAGSQASTSAAWLTGPVAKWLVVASIGTSLSAGTVAIVRHMSSNESATTNRVLATKAPTHERSNVRSARSIAFTAPSPHSQAPALPAPHVVDEATATPAPSNTVERTAVERSAGSIKRVAAVAPPTSTSSSPSPPAAATSLVEQVRVLREANAMFSAGQAREALLVLDASHAQLMSSHLAEEASALRVLCLCRLHESARLAAERASFFIDYPHSVHTRRVAEACAR